MPMNSACLLLHGFTGTPFEMESLGQALERAGFQVTIPLLPGHGTTVHEMDTTGFSLWYDAAEQAYLKLRRSADTVFVAGLSMGGSLTLRLAQEHTPDGIAVLATPVFIYRLFPPAMADWRLPLAPLLRLVRPIWPVSPASAKSREIQPWQGYDTAMPLNALSSFMTSLGDVRSRLGRINCPTLIMHDERDRTIDAANAYEIYNGISSVNKELRMLHIQENVTSHHVLTTHRETRDKICQRVTDFFAGLVAMPASVE